MNTATFQKAQDAYENQDFATALDLYNQVLSDQNFPLQVGEHGLVYHQIGNCCVKLSNYGDAINAYGNATADSAYVSIGTVYYNLGMAYAYMSDFGNAINNFNTAINIPNYRSKYKAYTAMGNALMKSGKSADAAAAFRNAAMDTTNPNPTRALLNLGVCFMALNRPKDAVSVYETAFQYNMDADFKNRLNANLGQAYAASGQMDKAIRAFEDSLRDKTYKLSDSAAVDYQKAIAAVSKRKDEIPDNFAQEDAMPSAPAEDVSYTDPQEAFATPEPAEPAESQVPLSNEFARPINEDEQFDKWAQSAAKAAYNEQVKKHPVRRLITILLFIIAGCIVAGSVLYCFGFGIPSQEMVCKDLFSNPIEARDKDFASSVSDSQKDSYCSMVTTDPNAKVVAVDRSVNESVAYVTADSGKGMPVTYKIKMSRYLIGWRITSIELTFASDHN